MFQRIRDFKSLEKLGVLFSFSISVLLYFCYELSGGAVFSIIFFSANHSLWEQAKILTLPFCFWSMMELVLLNPSIKDIIVAKTAGIYTIILVNTIVLKLFWIISGEPNLILNAVISLFSISISFFVSYKLMTSYSNIKDWFTIAAFSLVLFIAMFMAFTVNPPHMDIFKDPYTGIYGIPKRHLDTGALYLNKSFKIL